MRYGVRAFDTVYAVSQPEAAAAPADPNALDRETLVIAGVVLLGAIMSILDTTIVNVAIDRLSIDFNASLTTIQWVVTGYTLALAAVIPATGWAADRFGTKRIYLYSLALFMLGSALCPDFIIELRSQSDSLPVLEAKMVQWIANGAQVAWLIDPDRQVVAIYRPGQQPEVLYHPSSVQGDGVVAGFELEMTRIWS